MRTCEAGVKFTGVGEHKNAVPLSDCLVHALLRWSRQISEDHAVSHLGENNRPEHCSCTHRPEHCSCTHRQTNGS